MITLGITGSIGMGKSGTSDLLRYLGIPVHDADACVHDLYEDSDFKLQLGAAFPYYSFPQIYKRNKGQRHINRAELGKIVFEDPEARKTLESILHPAVRGQQAVFYARMKKAGHEMIGFDIPLLFETGADIGVDYTICVSAPYHVQKMRVLSRANFDDKKFHAVLDNQMSDREKQMRSDYIIKTGLGRAYAMRQIKKMIHEIQQTHKRQPDENKNAQDYFGSDMVKRYQNRIKTG